MILDPPSADELSALGKVSKAGSGDGSKRAPVNSPVPSVDISTHNAQVTAGHQQRITSQGPSITPRQDHGMDCELYGLLNLFLMDSLHFLFRLCLHFLSTTRINAIASTAFSTSLHLLPRPCHPDSRKLLACVDCLSHSRQRSPFGLIFVPSPITGPRLRECLVTHKIRARRYSPKFQLLYKKSENGASVLAIGTHAMNMGRGRCWTCSSFSLWD